MARPAAVKSENDASIIRASAELCVAASLLVSGLLSYLVQASGLHGVLMEA